MADPVFTGPIFPSALIKKVLKAQPLKLKNKYML